MSEDAEKILSESLHAMAQDIKERDAEIERLRDELSHCLHLDNHNAIVANRNEEIEHLRLMIGSLLDVTAGRMTDAEIKGAYGMLGWDVMRRAKELR